MKIKLMLAAVAVALVSLAGTVEAGPSDPYSCTPGAPCSSQRQCGVNPNTGQYLGICGTGPRVCLCYS